MGRKYQNTIEMFDSWNKVSFNLHKNLAFHDTQDRLMIFKGKWIEAIQMASSNFFGMQWEINSDFLFWKMKEIYLCK